MAARETNADRAAGPSAIRLDQLPAEVLQACALCLARRFKEALEQPFWSTLEWDLAARLWRALERPGTPEEASARRWLQVQGGAVKCVRDLTVGEGAEEHVPGRDLAGQLSTLLASLPALTSIDVLVLRTDPRTGATAAAHQAFLAGAARAIARCSSLQQLHLHVCLHARLAGQLPLALVRELASVRTLEEVTLTFAADFEADEADRLDWPATFSLADLVAGLAGLPRLRALVLAAESVGMDATLPASVSRLAQLTYLSLSGFHGLRCEPGWARLPALARLEFHECVFACDGEAALPGMDALVALTSFNVCTCPSLRVLPASLWGLTQLQDLAHWGGGRGLALAPRDALPVSCVPAGGAPCFASLTHLNLAGQNLQAFPPGILAAVRLAHLDLGHCCFEQLPEGVSVLTGLQELHLGRQSFGEMEIGGCLDARALGSLSTFSSLRALSFGHCSVLFSADFQAAAAHPRLKRLLLIASYAECGPSCAAFLCFVYALLQRGRPSVLELIRSVVEGARRLESRGFRFSLKAVGYPLSDADSRDLV